LNLHITEFKSQVIVAHGEMKYFTPLFYFTLSVSTMTSCPHLLGTVPAQGLPVSAVAAAPDTSIAYSRAAAAEVRNQLQSLHSEAEYEAAMKLKCLRYEKTIQTQQSAQFELTTAPIWPALSDGAWSLKPAFRVGDYVQVSEDLTAGHCSHGGTGWVDFVSGIGQHTIISVKYDENSTAGARLEHNIPVSRVHELPIPLGQIGMARPKPKRKAKDAALDDITNICNAKKIKCTIESPKKLTADKSVSDAMLFG
jgi:hypothetical protein